VKAFQYRTRGGALIPLCFSSKQDVIGIIPIDGASDIERFSGSINSFLGAFSRSKVIMVHAESAPLNLVKPRVLVAPMGYLLG
jgi:hypothetical protein